jgi:hypothetical protein
VSPAKEAFMKRYLSDVSNWIDLLVLVALTAVVGGIFLPVFPWSSLVFLTLATTTVLWMRRRTAHRSTAQVIWDLESEAGGRARPKPSPAIERF